MDRYSVFQHVCQVHRSGHHSTVYHHSRTAREFRYVNDKEGELIIAFWRKRLLVVLAYTGAISSTILLGLPTLDSLTAWIPLTTALITIISNVCYATSLVCANAFLPVLAREDPSVIAAITPRHEGGDEGEEDALLPVPELDVNLTVQQDKVLSLTVSRLSSMATGLGFFSGVFVLALLTIPISLSGGSTKGLCIAVGLCGIWWGVFTLPAAIGLPGGAREDAGSYFEGWRKVGQMIQPSEIRMLPNLFIFLFAWIFLSDGKLREIWS
jgi:UMF1 family MFS transporter